MQFAKTWMSPTAYARRVALRSSFGVEDLGHGLRCVHGRGEDDPCSVGGELGVRVGDDRGRA